MRVKNSFSIEGVFFIFVFTPFVIFLTYRSFAALIKDDAQALTYYERAQTLIQQGHVAEAQHNLYLGIFKAETIQPLLYRSLAHLYFKSHRYFRAAVWYDLTLKTDARYEPSVLGNLAICYAEIGKTRLALETLRRFARKYPHYVRAETRELLPILERRASQSAFPANANARLVFQLDVPSSAKRPLMVGGNWLSGGRQNDVYGYQFRPLHQMSKDTFDIKLQLLPFPDLPYRAVIKDSLGVPLFHGVFDFSEVKGNFQTLRLDWSNLPNGDVGRYISRLSRRAKESLHPKKHIFIFWIDGGSWWFIRSEVERGLLPNFADLIHNGAYAEMMSTPPFTAIAIKRLTTLDTGPPSFLDLALLELKGLQFVDRFIPKFISARKMLGTALRKRNLTFVDLTFNDPYIEDPDDVSSEYGFKQDDHIKYQFDPLHVTLDSNSISRKFVSAATLDGLFGNENLYGKWMLSNQWDDAEKKLQTALNILVANNSPEIILFRLPNSDILSHYFFENSAKPSNGNLFLELFYQYLDESIGRIRQRLGKEDTLFVISDHGILSHTQHHRSALFLADGPLFSGGVEYDSFPIQFFPKLLFKVATESKVPTELRPRK